MATAQDSGIRADVGPCSRERCSGREGAKANAGASARAGGDPGELTIEQILGWADGV